MTHLGLITVHKLIIYPVADDQKQVSVHQMQSTKLDTMRAINHLNTLYATCTD